MRSFQKESAAIAVDLEDLIDPLRRAISPPGINMFPDATDAELVGNLADGFWNAFNDGIISGYSEADFLITTIDTNAADMPRNLQQVIVFYASMQILFSALRDVKTMFRTKAGPVEFETQQSAVLLKDLLAELAHRRGILLQRLGDLGLTNTYYIDGVIARTDAVINGTTWFVG